MTHPYFKAHLSVIHYTKEGHSLARTFTYSGEERASFKIVNEGIYGEKRVFQGLFCQINFKVINPLIFVCG